MEILENTYGNSIQSRLGSQNLRLDSQNSRLDLQNSKIESLERDVATMQTEINILKKKAEMLTLGMKVVNGFLLVSDKHFHSENLCVKEKDESVSSLSNVLKKERKSLSLCLRFQR